MDEIMARKHIKKLVSHGIPKLMAKNIVETVIEMCKGKDMEKYIQYAVKLTYGLEIKHKAK